ncbi:WXG100 family type VII secretion target [Lentzea sp. JNUCC 0626]|uniref:WXG100 family type VII secretion target n=1 Tax=Lentzea sp. JNUCC 0626 TaxID=3367513 RepID=UPI0037492028
MAQNTRLTPEDVIAMANKHTAVADDISSQQRLLDGNIQNLVSTNQGALMTKLTSVHADWNTSTTDIVTNLRTMATTLQSVAQRLRTEDEQNAQAVNI